MEMRIGLEFGPCVPSEKSLHPGVSPMFDTVGVTFCVRSMTLHTSVAVLL